VPIYEYAPVSGRCRQCGGRFEVYQRIADAKLSACPDCGKAVERVISPVPVHGKYSIRSDSRLAEAGLTKYVKTSDGSYERTVGTQGPKRIREPKK